MKKQIKGHGGKTSERSVQYLSGCLGKYLERDDVPTKKNKKHKNLLHYLLEKSLRNLPRQSLVCQMAKDIQVQGDAKLVKEVADINHEFIKTKQEVDWTNLKETLGC